MSVDQKSDQKSDGNINFGTKAIDRINASIQSGNRTVSFEYFPPRTDKGLINLKKRLKNMVKWGPKWMDVTWGAGGSTSDLTPNICNYIQNDLNGNAMMHLTCTNMLIDKVDIALKQAKEMGFKNILALRGDPPKGQAKWEKIDGGFECALDLVKYIKKNYGDYFGITVSGYPEGHPLVRKEIDDNNWDPIINNNPKYWAPKLLDNGKWEGVSPTDWKKELNYLKQKIDAGGQVIITQLFYDVQLFIDWVKEVRAFGITAPILPGIMPIKSYGLFCRMTGFCRTVVPKGLKENLLKLKDSTSELYEYGMDYIHKMCIKILETKDNNNKYIVPGLHIYTMNQEKPTIHLLSLCQIGFDKDPSLKNLIQNELKRILLEERLKLLQTNSDAIKNQTFNEITTF